MLDFLKQKKELEEQKAAEEAQLLAEAQAAAAQQASSPTPTFACVVVDTNVLLDDIHLVDEWLSMIHKIHSSTKIVVPRAVMIELDGLNHNRTLAPERARKVRCIESVNHAFLI